MPTKKSRVYSLRLNPAVDTDAKAIEIIERLQDRGFSVRHIVTDAILRVKGHTPEMYHDAEETVTRSVLENLLSDFAAEIIHELRHTSGAAETPGQASPFDDDEADEDYARNLAQGYLSRRKRGQG